MAKGSRPESRSDTGNEKSDGRWLNGEIQMGVERSAARMPRNEDTVRVRVTITRVAALLTSDSSSQN